jgi:hypothetical protein
VQKFRARQRATKDWQRLLLCFCLLFSLAGCGGSSKTTITQQGISVALTTGPSTIGAGANWTYTANVIGSSNQTVTWSVSGGGTIDSSTGLYIAPNTVPNPATVTITATAAADTTATQSATVTVLANDPLGTVSETPLSSCTGYASYNTTPACYQLTVSCPGAADVTAYIKVLNPSSAPIGTVLFGTGTGGSGLYDDPTGGGYEYGSNVVQSITSAGYNTVQVSFGAPFTSSQPNGWLQGPGGVRRLACRYSTIADWVYKNPSIINAAVNGAANSKPMCATGNSGGSGAIAYAVYEYGLNTEFSMIEPTSGPVMSRIDQGCSVCSNSVEGGVCSTTGNTHPQMCYESADASVIDAAYQSSGDTANTPCTNALNGSPGPDASTLFLSDSILYQGTKTINIPGTTIKQLIGDEDSSNAVPQAFVWQGQASPSPTQQCLPNVEHDIPSYQTGANQIATDIIAGCH